MRNANIVQQKSESAALHPLCKGVLGNISILGIYLQEIPLQTRKEPQQASKQRENNTGKGLKHNKTKTKIKHITAKENCLKLNWNRFQNQRHRFQANSIFV